MKWLKDFLVNVYQPDKHEAERRSALKNYYDGLEEMLETALDRANNAENRASDAENRMLTMANLQNIDLVAEKARVAVKGINNLYVGSWKSIEERTEALESLIRSLLIAQIKGTPAWTEATDKHKGVTP